MKKLFFLLVFIVSFILWIFYINFEKFENKYLFVNNVYDWVSSIDRHKETVFISKDRAIKLVYVDNDYNKTILFFPSTYGNILLQEDKVKYFYSLWYNVLMPIYSEYQILHKKDFIKELNYSIDKFVEDYLLDKDKLIIVWEKFWGYFAVWYTRFLKNPKTILISPVKDTKSYFESNVTWLFHNFYWYNSLEILNLINRYSSDLLLVCWEINRLGCSTVEEVYKNSKSKNKEIIKIIWGSWDILNWYSKWLAAYIDDFIIWNTAPKNLEVKNNQVNLNDLFDFYTDDSITKFLNNMVSFNELSYIPSDLEIMEYDYYDTSKKMEISWVANAALKKMSRDFYEKFWIKIKVVSAYRSYVYQKRIKDRWCPDNLCSKAWYSEHQSWLAVDFFEATTNDDFMAKKDLRIYYWWLSENAHKYWFHNTYQKWLQVDWYDIEPWHWRYVWESFATYLKKNNMTFAEVYNKLDN